MDEAARKAVDEAIAFVKGGQFNSWLASVIKVAGFNLDVKYEKVFHEFNEFVTNPKPEFISRLLDDPKKSHWYGLLVGGVLTNVRGSFSCVLYHESRLREVEGELFKVIQQHEATNALANGAWGMGGTSVLDFEYQAYVLAYRRCLDQFAGAIGAFFKNQCTSFRKLPSFLECKKPKEVALAITQVHQKYAKNFEFVMSSGGEPSVRDRIAHYEFVQAGTLNVSARGILLVGGGEDLNVGGGDEVLLTDCLCEKSRILHQCIEEIIYAFINSVSAWEKETLR